MDRFHSLPVRGAIMALVLLCSVSAGCLTHLQAQEERIIRPPEDNIIWSVAFNPDGKTFAAGLADKVLLYDTASGTLLKSRTFQSGHATVYDDGEFVFSLDFSMTGKSLAVCCGRGSLFLWETLTDKHPVVLEGHKRSVQCGRFSPNGSLFASGSRDGILIWDIEQQRIKLALGEHGVEVRCVAFSPNGNMLASGTEAHIVLWNINTGKHMRTLESHNGELVSITFSPDGKTLVSGHRKNACVWDVDTGDMKETIVFGNSVVGLHIFSDNRTLIGANSDGIIRMWNLEQRQLIGDLTTRHRLLVRAMAISPDQQTAVCAVSDHTLQLIGLDRFRKRKASMVRP